MAAIATEEFDSRTQQRAMDAAQRGTTERLKEPSLASRTKLLNKAEMDVLNAEIVQAERIGRQSLGDAPEKIGLGKHSDDSFQVAASLASSSYIGPIVGETARYSIQKINPVSTVRHFKEDLPSVPQVGDNVRISYAACKATIKPVQAQEKTRKHTLSL